MTDRPICPICNQERDKPELMSDDAYSQFLCPHPFHRDPKHPGFAGADPQELEAAQANAHAEWERAEKAEAEVERLRHRRGCGKFSPLIAETCVPLTDLMQATARVEDLEQALREIASRDSLAVTEAGQTAWRALHPDQRKTTEPKPCPWCSYPKEPQTP